MDREKKVLGLSPREIGTAIKRDTKKPPRKAAF